MRIAVVHLSDIHIEDSDDAIVERGGKIVDAVASVASDVAWCSVVISGDVAYSGKQDQYATAIELMESIAVGLTERLSLSTVEFVLTPGNHDCDFALDNKVRERVAAGIWTSPEDALDEDVVAVCTTPQDEYFSFHSLFDSDQLSWHNRLYYEYRFNIDGHLLVFRCLNTAWLSQLHEKQGDLYFPVDVVPVDPYDQATVVISVLHHPYNWLESNNARVLRERLELVSDVILTGHEHVSAVYRKSDRLTGKGNEYIEGAVLQDSRDSEHSAFRLIELDLSSKQQRSTAFEWSKERYVRLVHEHQEWSALQVNELRLQRRFLPNSDFAKYLEDPGATFTTSRGELGLSDIYVYPYIRKQEALSARHEPVRASAVIALSDEQPRLIIDGPTDAGKTALAKTLFADFLDAGYVPVLLRGAELSDRKSNKVENLVERAFVAQYGETLLEEYRQLLPEKRVVLVDDFTDVRLNSKGRATLLRELTRYFKRTILFSNDFALQLEEITQSGKTSVFSSFSTYRLLEFGYTLRDELADRWMRPDLDIESRPAELANRMKRTRDVLDTVLARSFIPSYPIFVLTVLQLVESNLQLDTTAASYGYGYFYEALVQSQLEQVSSRLDPSTRHTYLAELAYHLYRTRSRSITLEELKHVHETYCEVYRRRIDFERTISDFRNANILSGDTYSLRFKYGYYYYYFVAAYLRDRMTEPAAREDIKHMATRVYKEEYSNILLFLTHLSKDPYIIDQMLTSSKSIYHDVRATDLDSDVSFLNELFDDVPELVYEDRDPEDVRRAIAEGLDSVDELDGTEPEERDLDAQEESEREAILEINRAYKSIQILGQILKNSPGSIKGDRKLEVAEEVYGLSRRLLSKIFLLVKSHSENLVRDMADQVQSRRPEADRAEVVERIRKLLFILLKAVTLGVVKWTTRSIGSEKLVETYQDMRAQDDSVATALIDTSIKLDHVGVYPLEDLKRLAARLDSNLFGYSLLQFLVMYHMDMYYVKREMKQRMCELVGVRYRPLTSPHAIQRPDN